MDKTKRQKRIQQKIRHVHKQLSLRKRSNLAFRDVDKDIRQPHRLQKKSAHTCGNSNCAMCGNPRKFFGEMTPQEKSFIQTQKWFDEDGHPTLGAVDVTVEEQSSGVPSHLELG